jgi:DNA-binding SARP family transcriptional activator/tetratricopeptide (TPR) repeat protein
VLRFRLLGPFEVELAGAPVGAGGPRQRTVLAMLALTPNRAVSIERLTAAMYGQEPPASARVQVQIIVSALRRLFATVGRPDVIDTRPGGYALRVDDDQIDLRRYEALVAQGRAARDAGQPGTAVVAYRSALALWRGPALDGLDSDLLRAAATRLEEQHLVVVEDRIALELDLGRHRDVLGELVELSDEHPLRERLHELLMLALYREDRRADALEVYRRIRRRLVDELGIEPGAGLQRIQHAILTDDVGPAPTPVPDGGAPHGAEAALPPRLLPIDIAHFTGRAAQVEAVETRLAAGAAEGAGVPVVAINGRPGVGKTALAVHVAHRLAERYPDGHLFADLRGPSAHPAEPTEILGRFLRVLGASGGALREGVDAGAELYRHLLAERRMLVVLDNAGDESQVLPLLPGASRSAVVVTSRHRLGALPGALHVEVDLLEPDSAVVLLSRMVGAHRVDAEPGAAAALAGRCGYLPLALRIAGARLIGRPHWTIERLAARLADQERRLDELQYGPLGVRTSLTLSYEGLSARARQLLRGLANVDFPFVSAWTAAALVDCGYAAAADLLDELTDARLLDVDEDGHRYRCHDLVRVFARERLLVEDPAPVRRAALARVLGALLFLAERANRVLAEGDVVIAGGEAPRWPLPDDVTQQLIASPMAWLNRERHTLTSGVRLAAEARLGPLSWELAFAASWAFEEHAEVDEWRQVLEIALSVAEEAEHPRGQAAMHYSLGSAHMFQQRFDDARPSLLRSAELFGQLGETPERALPLRNLAYVDRLRGDLDSATRHYEEALALLRHGGFPVGVAYVLHGLASVRLEHGDCDAALALLDEALELSRHGTTRRVEAQVRYRQGEVWLRLDEPERAADAFGEALAALGNHADPVGRGFALHGFGHASLRAGRLADADGALREALRLAETTRNRLLETRCLLGLAELAIAGGRSGHADQWTRRAVELARAIDVPLYRARAAELRARVDDGPVAPEPRSGPDGE